MRAFFLFLVLANLAFLAWTRFAPDAESSSDPRPLRSQIAPEKVRILPAAPLASRPAPGPAAPPAAPGGSAATVACLEWGSFTLAAAPAAEQALEPLALGARLARRQVEETAGWWVYMPPQGNRANAQKKAAELKGLGVEEWFIVADEGRWRWAVSLGVFRTEDAAKNRLESLRVRGVRSALMGQRETQVQKIWLQARNVEAAQALRVREIGAGYPGTEVRDCQP